MASKAVVAGIKALIDATKGAPKSMGALGKMDKPQLGDKEADALYESYLANLAKPKESISDDSVMRDVLDSFLESKKIDPQPLTLPEPEDRLELYEFLNLMPAAKPKQGELISGSADWYKDYDLLAPPMQFETFLKNRYGLDVIDIMGVE